MILHQLEVVREPYRRIADSRRLVSLQEAMGHESLETTRVYLSDVASYLNRRREPTNALRAAAVIVSAPADSSRAEPGERGPNSITPLA